MSRFLAFLFLLFAFVLSTPLAAQDSAMLSARLDEIASTMASESSAPAVAVAVIRDGEELLVAGYGLSDVENDLSAAAETVFRIGSITKQFTAASIMKLKEDGKLMLTDPITKYIPEYPEVGDRITIHHLLNHTSGIKSYTGMGEAFWSKSRLDLSHQEMLDLFGNEDLDFEPGEQWLYNNSGYYLLVILS